MSVCDWLVSRAAQARPELCAQALFVAPSGATRSTEAPCGPRMGLTSYASASVQAATWAETRAATALAAAEREARSGLVSVPTTRPQGLKPEIVEANVRAGRQELLGEVGAFVLDPAARRYSGLRMAVGFAARAHAVSEKGHRSDVAWMVTLTYAGDKDAWKPEHLTTAINTFRKWCKRAGVACRYVWVAELQKRGVIHYHIAAWLPRGYTMPKWDRRGWWPHGMTNTLKARHATAYLMAYLKKGDLEQRGALPKGARNYGVGGLDHALRRARRWLRLPAFVQANSSIHDSWKRCVGGGWIAPSGEHFGSEYETVFIAGQRALRRVRTHARSIEAHGPFSWLGDRAAALARLH